MKLFFKSFSDRFDVGVVSAIQRIFHRRCLFSLALKSSLDGRGWGGDRFCQLSHSRKQINGTLVPGREG